MRKPGRPTASKTTAAKEAAAPEKEETVTQIGTTFSLKSTVSLKQRNEDGDEVFVSAGLEIHGVGEDDIDSRRQQANGILDGWIAERAEAVGGISSGGDEEEEAEEEEEEEAEEAELDITEDDVKAMKKAELDALIAEHNIEVDAKAKLADKREAIIAALFGEEEEEEEAEEEEGEEEEFVPYTAAELKGMKLAELDEIANDWELAVKHKKGADLATKKANVIAAITKHQEETAEE